MGGGGGSNDETGKRGNKAKKERPRGGTHMGAWRLRGERRGKAQAIRRRMSSTSQRGVAQRKEARESTMPLCAPPRGKAQARAGGTGLRRVRFVNMLEAVMRRRTLD